MSKSLQLAKVSAVGGLNLLWGLIVSSVISAVGMIFVAGMLSEAEYGVVSIVLIGPNIIAFVRDLGIDQATIKYVTQYRVEEDQKKLKDILITGTLFEVVLGTVFTVISIVLSGLMANVLERPTIVPLIQIASFTVLAGALFKAAQSGFIGYDKMKHNSVLLVLQSVFKTSLMVGLVYFGFGEYGAIIGNSLSYISAGLVGVAILYVTIIKKFEKTEVHIGSTLKTLLKFGIPLSVAVTIAGILAQFYSFMVALYTPDLLVGNYQVAVNFGMLVSIFAQSVTTIMFPTFSKVNGHEDQKTLANVFRYSVKYTSLLVVPATFAVMALSEPGVQTIFQNKYEFTPLYLALYVSTFLYCTLGNLSSGALIKSQGQTKLNMNIILLTVVLGLVFALITVPTFGVIGLLVGNMVIGMPGILISLWWIRKHYNATIDWKSSTKILLASAFSGILTYLVTSQLTFASWINLIIGTAIFLASYVVVAPLIGALDYKDTQNLKALVRSLGPLAAVINPLVASIEKIASRKQKQ